MESISKNFNKGEPLQTIQELYVLSNNKGSVYTRFWGIKPAAVIMSMQCRMVYNLIAQKSIFYTVNKKVV